MSAAGVAVDWFGSRVLLNLFVIPVVLEAGRLGVDWISGMPASALGEGTVAAMPAGPCEVCGSARIVAVPVRPGFLSERLSLSATVGTRGGCFGLTVCCWIPMTPCSLWACLLGPRMLYGRACL